MLFLNRSATDIRCLHRFKCNPSSTCKMKTRPKLCCNTSRVALNVVFVCRLHQSHYVKLVLKCWIIHPVLFFTLPEKGGNRAIFGKANTIIDGVVLLSLLQNDSIIRLFFKLKWFGKDLPPTPPPPLSPGIHSSSWCRVSPTSSALPLLCQL